MPIISKSQDQKEDQIIDMARQIAVEYESKNLNLIAESQKMNQEAIDASKRDIEGRLDSVLQKKRKTARRAAVASTAFMSIALGCFLLYDRQVGIFMSAVAVFIPSVLDLIDD